MDGFHVGSFIAAGMVADDLAISHRERGRCLVCLSGDGGGDGDLSEPRTLQLGDVPGPWRRQ
jgi:hypothetical protein